MALHRDEDDDKPLDPAVERVRRRLVRFVAINLGLLFLALMAVVAAIVYRAGRSEPPPAPVTELPVPPDGGITHGEVALPAGARVVGHALSGARLTLDVELPGGRRSIFVYDTAVGRIVGRFDVVTSPGSD